MLEVVRFWLTKDIKYAKGRPCKPYNSCLGEFFRVRTDHHNGPRIRSAGVQREARLALADRAASSVTGRLKIMPRASTQPSSKKGNPRR